MKEAPLIGISRLRMGTDGRGVTTLVAFHGCPLHCKYCLNPHCNTSEGIWKTMTPQQVYDEVKKSVFHLRLHSTKYVTMPATIMRLRYHGAVHSFLNYNPGEELEH